MKCSNSGDFFQAWGGITALQLGLSSVWTEASRRGYSLEQVVEWLSARPARLAGLEDRKGSIAEGKDADLIFFRPDGVVEWPQVLHHRHKLTPYEGRPLKGIVELTLVRGTTVYQQGQFLPSALGRLLFGRLRRLNTAPADQALSDFIRCCGSTKWAAKMENARPFASVGELLEEADRAWSDTTVKDWLEAFRAHPRIGESSGSKWSQQEQAGTRSAAADVQKQLVEGNRNYFERFGFIFIICATGKNASELLVELHSRMKNDRETELKNAAEQQRLITRLRLRKLVGS